MSQKLKKNQMPEVDACTVQLLDGLVKFQIFYCQVRDLNSISNHKTAAEDPLALKLLPELEEIAEAQTALAPVAAAAALAAKNKNDSGPVPGALVDPEVQIARKLSSETGVEKDGAESKVAVVRELLSTLSELKSEQEKTKTAVLEKEGLTDLELASLSAAAFKSFLDDVPAQDSPLKKPSYKNQDQYPDLLREEAVLLKKWDQPGPVRKKKKSFSFLTSIFRRVSLSTVGAPLGRLKKNQSHSLAPKAGVDYFFRVVNDELLFNLGNSYYQDFKKGQKHFAFAHVNAAESQKRSILGVASFIKYFEGSKILIVTGQMGRTYYEAFKGESLLQSAQSPTKTAFSYKVYVVNSLHYVEVDELSKHVSSTDQRTFAVTVKAIMDDYDLVLFDLPPTADRKEQYDVYLPLLHTMESVTLTVSLGKNRFSEIDELMKYFTSYNIKIKGSIVDRKAKKTSSLRSLEKIIGEHPK